MRLIVGCPVAHRAWALPTWFACLAAQTRRPDALVFIHSGEVHDATWMTIQREAVRHHLPSAIRHDPAPAHPRHDNARFTTLGRLRNDMLAMAHDHDAELLFSLDTDVMLENPRTIEHLEGMILSGDCDIAAPVTWMHPLGEGSYAYNAGWWVSEGRNGDPQRAWVRPPATDIHWDETYRIDIPMAAWLANERAIACRYEPHESGEDLGFAQDLERHHIECLWNTSLKARHIWSEQAFRDELAAAA